MRTFVRSIRDQVIAPGLRRLGAEYASPEAVDLIAGTGAAESGYCTFVQTGGGPALGFWQIEPATATDLVRRYLSARADIQKRLDAALWSEMVDDHFLAQQAIGLQVLPRMDDGTMKRLLANDLGFGVALARLRYWWAPEPLPRRPSQPGPQSNLAYWVALGGYWKKHYNTAHGAGSAAHWLAAVRAAGLVD